MLNKMERRMLMDTNNMLSRFEQEEQWIGAYAYDNYLEYKLIDNQLIVLSDIAYWKIVYLADWECFVLYHGNSIPEDIDPEKYVDADYHFQKDVKGADNIMSLIIYIKNHDDFRCKMIANVENMPRRTKKQKAQYNKVKAKEEAYKKAIVLQMISAAALVQTQKVAG